MMNSRSDFNIETYWYVAEAIEWRKQEIDRKYEEHWDNRYLRFRDCYELERPPCEEYQAARWRFWLDNRHDRRRLRLIGIQ